MKSKIASCAAVFAVLGISTAGAAQRTPAPREIHVPGNPILAGGAYYSADPAPVVIGDKLYIIAGHDEAPPGVDSFVMNDWQLLATDNPASGNWTHYPAVIRPHQVFKWAAPGNAYAAQIVNGPDGRLYLYAPVREASTDAKDAFAIGVAVADSPTGPWRDAHPAGPIISQRVPVPNQIENIDPTVLVDDDGRVFIYWGTFGQLRGMELARDMVTPKGPEVPIKGAKGFFEASWLMKRKQVYYLLYAANNAGPESRCTPAVYHACIAYATATAPLGPWTYRGIVLKPVSSTTSHPGAIAFKGQWYLVYHTADGTVDASVLNFGAGTNPVIELSYTSLAHVVQRRDHNGDALQNEYFIAFGQQTPIDRMPHSGSAHYTGVVMGGGYVEGIGQGAAVSGTMNAQIDFGSLVTSAEFDLLAKDPNGVLSNVDLGTTDLTGEVWPDGFTASNNTIAGLSFHASGDFYGPNVNEIGGPFTIRKDGGTIPGHSEAWDVAGAFVGKKN